MAVHASSALEGDIDPGVRDEALLEVLDELIENFDAEGLRELLTTHPDCATVRTFSDGEPLLVKVLFASQPSEPERALGMVRVCIECGADPMATGECPVSPISAPQAKSQALQRAAAELRGGQH